MVRGAVVAGNSRPVQAEHHGQVVQADVQVGLVEGSAQERGVEGYHGAESTHGHPSRRRHRMLLGDAHVKEPVAKSLAKRQETGGVRHGSRDGHHFGP